MKILFVCQGNVGRSQIAQAFFALKSEHDSECAGTRVRGNEGQRLNELAQEPDQGLTRATIEVMQEKGINLSDNIRRQVTPEMVDHADEVFVMAERDTWPEFLETGGKVQHWAISIDIAGIDYDGVRGIRDKVEDLDSQLVRRIG